MTATWMIHAGNIIFNICPRQLNGLGLRPIRDSPDDMPPQFFEPAHHTGHLQLRMMAFDVVITCTAQKVARGTAGSFVAVTIVFFGKLVNLVPPPRVTKSLRVSHTVDTESVNLAFAA